MPSVGWIVCDGLRLGVFAAAVLVSLALSATYLAQDTGRALTPLRFDNHGSATGPGPHVPHTARSVAELPTPEATADLNRQITEKQQEKNNMNLPAGLAADQSRPEGSYSGTTEPEKQAANLSRARGETITHPAAASFASQLNQSASRVSVYSDDPELDSPYDGCSAVRNAPREQQCALSTKKCKTLSGDSILDYMSLHYCYFHGNPFISVPLFTLCLLLAFYLLADTAENFFCPTVTTLSEMLNLAPNTAGVTLLALGNGAPDLLGSLASFSNGDPHIIVGAILSAGTFVTSFVVGSVALFVAPIPVEGPAFMRNAAMYGMGVILSLTVYSGRVLYFWQAAGLVVYYFLFVAMVIFFDRREHPTECAEHEEDSYSNAHEHEHKQKQRHAATATAEVSSAQYPSHRPIIKIDVDDDDSGDWLSGRRRQERSDEEGRDSRRMSGASDADSTRNQQSSLLENLLSPCQRCHSGRLMEHPGMPHSKSIVCQESSVGRGISSASLALNVVKRPIHFIFDPIRWATVPTGQHPQDQDTYYGIANVLFCPAVFLWGLDSTFNLSLEAPLPLLPQLPTWLPLYFVAVLLGSLSWARSHSSIPPLWVVVASFSLSITWVGIFARELLGILSSLGAVLGASDALLGVTVLAWGNSIGDLVTNVTMALSGQPMMAIAGCFAGPLFNLMLGLGIPLTIKTFWMYPEPWHFHDDPHISLVFPFLLTSVAGSLCAVYFSGYKLTRGWGCFLILWYLLFIVVSVLMELISGI